MKIKKPLIIVLGEPNSVFIEILTKVLIKYKIKKNIEYPVILIGSNKLILSQLKILRKKLNFEKIDKDFFKYKKLENN